MVCVIYTVHLIANKQCIDGRVPCSGCHVHGTVVISQHVKVLTSRGVGAQGVDNFDEVTVARLVELLLLVEDGVDPQGLGGLGIFVIPPWEGAVGGVGPPPNNKSLIGVRPATVTLWRRA